MARLKIFIVHPSDWLTDYLTIGDGLVAHGFLQELANRGHEIHIAARSAKLQKPFPPNVTIHIIPQSVSLKPLDRLEYMARVRSLYRRLSRTIKFDVAHQMNPVFTGLSLCMAGFDVPLVLGTYVPDWPDDPDAVTSRRGLAGVLARWAKSTICAMQQSRADAFLLTSPASRPRIHLGEEATARIRYVQHGIDTEMFSPRADQAALASASPSILFLSNLGVKKGIFVLLEAFSDVIAAVPDCTLTIAGGGKELEEIKAIVEKQPWANQVSILGRLPREETVDLYRSHTLYTLPSFGEPYATTILEAMSCGRPVVSTDTGGVPYMILPGGGITVPPKDAPALAKALVQLLKDKESAAAMGQRNRAWMLKWNTWNAVINQLEEIYAEVGQRRQANGGAMTVGYPTELAPEIASKGISGGQESVHG